MFLFLLILLSSYVLISLSSVYLVPSLGTGNRREVTSPARIMDDVYITDVACGADFTLALESQGQLWAWGSNFYSQVRWGIEAFSFFFLSLSPSN